MDTQKTNKDCRITFRIDDEMNVALQKLCDRTRRKRAEVLRLALVEELEKHGFLNQSESAVPKLHTR